MGWLLPKYRHIIALFRTWNRLTELKRDRIVSKVLKWDIKMVNGWSKQFQDIYRQGYILTNLINMSVKLFSTVSIVFFPVDFKSARYHSRFCIFN